MICPSCQHENEEAVRYCSRCRMSFSKTSLVFSRLRGDLYWILRRATAGFTVGLVAWFFIPIVSRILSEGFPPMVVMPLTGLMGGAFLGCVDGLAEESSTKTIWGAFLGGLGGLAGGILFVLLYETILAQRLSWAIFIYWAVPGAAIGMVSAIWERQTKKILAGVICGFVGGGIGGYLGTGMHANLVQNLNPETWLAQRLAESLIGAFLGVTLWFAIGMAERYFIFKRRFLPQADAKICDQCNKKNPLKSWYCGHCGSVLQISVPMAKLHLPPEATLYHVSEIFHFSSRLAGATGFLAGFSALFIFIPGNPFLVIVALVLVALTSYAFQTLFLSAAELLQILARK